MAKKNKAKKGQTGAAGKAPAPLGTESSEIAVDNPQENANTVPIPLVIEDVATKDDDPEKEVDKKDDPNTAEGSIGEPVPVNDSIHQLGEPVESEEVEAKETEGEKEEETKEEETKEDDKQEADSNVAEIASDSPKVIDSNIPPIQGSSPEPTPIPTKKRLTLKERLALAAKGKSKKLADSNLALPQTPNGLTPVTSNDQEAHSESPAPAGEIPVEETELSRLKKQYDELELKNTRLEEKVMLLNSRSTSVSVTNLDSDKQIKELKAKLASKDETIQQLLKEGETLSVKELKLNETIKKLKSTNFNLEMNLKDYSEKTNETNLKMVELEDLLKQNNFKSITQLIENYTMTTQNLALVQATLDAELANEWESKYRELLKRFEEEVVAKKDALKDINDLKIQLNMAKRQHSLELESKTNIINDLKREMSSSKLESLHEISRLESKIESLRMENEGSNKSHTVHNEPEQSTTKSIEYSEFEKLSDTHHNLQQQYLSSQANWKVIEANLLNKIDSMSGSNETLKKSKMKLSQDLKKLNSSLTEQAEENKKLNESYKAVVQANEELKFSIQVKETDLLELQDKLEKFKQIYNSQKASMDIKVQSLTETIDTLKSENINGSLTSLKKLQEGGLHLTLDTPIKQTFRGNSSQSIADTSGQFLNPSWNDIKLGESSTTPAANFSTFQFTSSMNNSRHSLTSDENGSEHSDDYSLSRHHSFSHNNSHISSAIPVAGNNNNIHLINKMSSNIRRLEIELHTLKEENHQLSLDKEDTEQKLLDKLKLSDEISTLHTTIADLRTQIDSNNQKEQTMLELIGEKSEQVEELKADIVDLKELCKLQVQQMIEIQERSSTR